MHFLLQDLCFNNHAGLKYYMVNIH